MTPNRLSRHETCTAQSPDHPRLRTRGLQRRSVCGARQSRAAADHGCGAGRTAHDDHRRRQLAGRCRGTAGPGAHGAHETPCRALRHRHRQRSHRQCGPRRCGRFELQRRRPRLQLRCADHRHRGDGPLPGAAVGGALPRPWRLGVRHLRRLLLPRPARRGGGRRQHRGRGGAVSVAHRAARHARAPARQAARGEDPAGAAVSRSDRGQDGGDLEPHRR